MHVGISTMKITVDAIILEQCFSTGFADNLPMSGLWGLQLLFCLFHSGLILVEFFPSVFIWLVPSLEACRLATDLSATFSVAALPNPPFYYLDLSLPPPVLPKLCPMNCSTEVVRGMNPRKQKMVPELGMGRMQ